MVSSSGGSSAMRSGMAASGAGRVSLAVHLQEASSRAFADTPPPDPPVALRSPSTSSAVSSGETAVKATGAQHPEVHPSMPGVGEPTSRGSSRGAGLHPGSERRPLSPPGSAVQPLTPEPLSCVTAGTSRRLEDSPGLGAPQSHAGTSRTQPALPDGFPPLLLRSRTGPVRHPSDCPGPRSPAVLHPRRYSSSERQTRVALLRQIGGLPEVAPSSRRGFASLSQIPPPAARPAACMRPPATVLWPTSPAVSRSTDGQRHAGLPATDCPGLVRRQSARQPSVGSPGHR